MTESTPRIVPSESILLAMDFQSGILARITGADVLLERTKEAIAVARAEKMRVGYVRVAFEDGDLAAFPARNKMAERVRSAGSFMHAGSPTTAIAEAIAPEPGDIVVRKTRVGAFSTTSLDAQLRTAGITTLVLAGISTSGVVLSTVRDAADRDYGLVVLEDACADPEPDVHAFLMERVLPRQADVVMVEALASLFEQR